jgi:hypothetical protein
LWRVSDQAGKTLAEATASLTDSDFRWIGPETGGQYAVAAGIVSAFQPTPLPRGTAVIVVASPTPTPTATPSPTPTQHSIAYPAANPNPDRIRPTATPLRQLRSRTAAGCHATSATGRPATPCF